MFVGGWSLSIQALLTLTDRRLRRNL